MDRVFLDANVLFSASYRQNAGLSKLWNIEHIQLISSSYAVQEAKINLDTNQQRNKLAELIDEMELIAEWNHVQLPHTFDIPVKDRPIMQAAIAAQATHLLTGDIRHFGQYFGKSVQKVKILMPGEYMRRKKL